MDEATKKIDSLPYSKKIILYAIRIFGVVLAYFILGQPAMDSCITIGLLLKFGAAWITSTGAIFVAVAILFVIVVFFYSRLRKQPSDDEEM